MIRKWMTALLSLMLALMLPLCALAGTQHTLTIIPGDELASQPAVADLLNVLALTVTPGEKSGALTLTLDDTDIVTIALGADVTGLYAQSTLLGEDVFYITWDDAFALIKDAMRTELIDESVNSAGIDSMLGNVDAAKEQLISTLGGGVVMQTGLQTPEEAIAEATAMFEDDPEMVEWIKNLYGKMIVEDGSFAKEGCDAADQKYTMTMTKQDFLALLDTKYAYQTIWSSIEQTDPDLGGDNLGQMTEAALNEARAIFENGDLELKMEMFTLDAGETLVGMDMDMTMTVVEEEVPSTAVMNVDYGRKTEAEGVHYDADVVLFIDEVDVMAAQFDFTRRTDAVSEGMLALMADGEEILFTYDAENPEADVRDRKVSLYLRSGAASIIEPAASDRPLITFRIVSRPADPALLADMESADASSSVNVMKLSEEELANLISEISGRGMQAVYQAMAKLPTSVLSLLSEGM